MWNPESGKICLWNPESWVLESGIQLKESGIPQIFCIRNPISIDKRLESSNWKLESTVWNPESRIKDCLGFPNMGQILSSISAVMASMLNKNLGLKTRLSEKEKKHYFPFAFGCAIGPSSCMLPSARPMSFSFAELTVLRLQVNCKTFFVVIMNDICLLALNIRVATLRENYSCNDKDQLKRLNKTK